MLIYISKATMGAAALYFILSCHRRDAWMAAEAAGMIVFFSMIAILATIEDRKK